MVNDIQLSFTNHNHINYEQPASPQIRPSQQNMCNRQLESIQQYQHQLPRWSSSVQEMSLDLARYLANEKKKKKKRGRPPAEAPSTISTHRRLKKCGNCSEDKHYRSYTKEQWRVTEDDERECKVCEKYSALSEQGKAQKPLEESHLMYCQFINSDGLYGENANKNCSDVDDGWRPSPKCSNTEYFMQMNRHQPTNEGSDVDDDSTGDASLQFLVGGALYDEDPSIPPPPPPAVEQPPPPPAVELPPANPPRVLTPFVELSPGVNGAVDNATILSGMTFVLTGQFPEVPFGPEPQGVQGEQDYRSPDHRIIKNTIESFGGQVRDSIPPCDCKLPTFVMCCHFN